MLPFRLNLIVFLRITAISLANPVPLGDASSVKQAPRSVSSPSLSDDSISSSSSIADLILSSNDNLSAYQNDVTPGLLTTAGDGSNWVDGPSLPQQQQQQQQPQAIASCGGASNRKRAEAGQQLDGAGGGENICVAPPDNITPVKGGGQTAQQQQQQQQRGERAKEKEIEESDDEFYDGGGSRRGPTQIFPTDEDVQLQNEIQAAKNRQLGLNDPSRCNFAPFFVHICCSGELGPTMFDDFRGGYYQFVGSCILREFFFSDPENNPPFPSRPPALSATVAFFFSSSSSSYLFNDKKKKKLKTVNTGDICTRPRDLCCEYFRVSSIQSHSFSSSSSQIRPQLRPPFTSYS